MIKAVIIDNDLDSTEDLEGKLAQYSNIHLIGKATSACCGIQLVQDKSPNLLFLNVELPEKSGFDLIKILRNQQARIPFVIFITIHSEFTLQALRTGAIDCLLKPIDENELRQAISRATDEIYKSNNQNKIDHLIEYVSKYKQIFLPSATGYKTVNIREIVFIRKNSNSSKIEVFFGDDDILTLPINYSLSQLKEILPKIDFFLIKRDVIINLRYLSEIEVFTKECTLNKGGYQIKLEISRRSLKEFKNRMVI
jgi:two-component system, LytTR family, response regulator